VIKGLNTVATVGK